MKSFRPSRRKLVAVCAAIAAIAAPSALAVTLIDFGKQEEDKLERWAGGLFGGIGTPLDATAPSVVGASGAASVALASGLSVSGVLSGNTDADPTNQLYQNADMIAFWPNDTNPRWAIVCIENGDGVPGVQRIRLSGPNKGRVETILTGTIGCDGIRRTPWNTIVATEEILPGEVPSGPGWAIEIYKPADTDGVVFDRATGTVSGSEAGNVHARPAVGRLSYEGLEILPDGTMYYGNELSPSNDADGGAIYKFVSSQAPAQPLDAETIDTLSDPAHAAESPLAAGAVYALQVGGTGSNHGQANQRGTGKWIGPLAPVDNLTVAAQAAKATGYYRPEDLHLDPIAQAEGKIRFCWANTGVSSLENWGEVLCLDDVPNGSDPTGERPSVQTFLEGNPLMNQPDNLAFQPRTGILYVIEDTPRVNGVSVPGDVWACLRDGDDLDLQTDGCVRVLSVKTACAEPTGFTFDGAGTKAYVNIQHSPDIAATAGLDESTFDEMLVISGFKPGSATAQP